MLRVMLPHEFPKIYALLCACFPTDELRPESAQRALLNTSNFSVFVTDDLSAVMTLWEFEHFRFLEHFAVAPTHRNQGLGSRLLSEVVRMSEKPLCLEAELPQTELARRRLDFYRRNGFLIHPDPYVQPPYAPERNSVPMCLLTTAACASKDAFIAIRNTLYRHVYGIQ